MQKIKTRDLAIMAMLVALEVVLSRFLSINAWNTRIGFGFVPIVLAAMLLGPIPAAIVAAIADVIGAILFPTGAFFPGFTLTAVLNGLNYGIWLHKNPTLPKIIAAIAIHQICFSWLLNTYWISVLYGSPYKPLLVTRLFQTGIISVVQLICIPILAQISVRFKKILK